MPPKRPSRATPEALQALRERLEATQRAAQQLAEDAAAARAAAAAEAQAQAAGADTDAAGAGSGAGASDRPPPMGWDVPRSTERANAELEALIALLGTIRDVLPPDLREQLAQLVRAILEFVRAVLDWWIGRLESGQDGAGDGRDDVQDIPIS